MIKFLFHILNDIDTGLKFIGGQHMQTEEHTSLLSENPNF